MDYANYWLASTLRRAVDEYGGAREAGVAAWNLPLWRKQLEENGAHLETTSDGLRYLKVQPDCERRIATIVEAALRLGEAALGPLEDNESTNRLPRRDPLPVRLVETVLGLREDQGKPWKDIDEELKGVVSHRKIDYVRVALKHGDLGWDRGQIVLGPKTRNTPAGIVLPKR